MGYYRDAKGKMRRIVKRQFNELVVSFYNASAELDYRIHRRTKVHDGILFQSDSKEGLDLLINYYEKAKAESMDDSFFDQVRETELGITDYIPKRAFIDQNGDAKKQDYGSYFSHNNYVYIEKEYILFGNVQALYHELGHCLDFNNEENQIGYDGIKKATENFITSTFDEEQNFVSDNFFNFNFRHYYVKFQNAYLDYMNKLDEALKEEEHQKNIEMYAKMYYEYYFKSTDYSTPEYQDMKYWSYRNYKELILRKSGYDALSDIYDALTGGELKSSILSIGNKIDAGGSYETGFYFKGVKSKYLGHSKEYYKKPIRRSKEIVANIASIINSGNTNLLYEFFPKETADGFIDTYKKIASFKENYNYEEKESKTM